jgi:hypothetical protein
MCNRLGIITSSTWSDIRGKPTPSTIQLPELIDSVRTDLSTWEHFAEFNALVEHTHDEHLPAFPLCDHCAEIATEHANRLNDMMKHFVENIASIARYGDEFNSQALQDPEPLSPFQIRPLRSSAPIAPSDPPAQKPVFEAEPITEPEPIIRRVNSKFAQLAAFRLAIIGPFATINSLRLGRLNSVNVPLHEIQNGLMLLCRFLIYQMKTVGLDLRNVRISSTIQFMNADGIFELRIPKHSKECDRFNSALTYMMGHFNAVFSSEYMRSMRPANLIDIGKKTISGESFLYTKAEPVHFTRAMRKLIVNLKTVQAYQTIFAS